MASLSQFHIRILLNGPQDARPGKFRFAYAESPAKQRRDRDVRDTAHNPNELGRICILLVGVCQNARSDRQTTPLAVGSHRACEADARIRYVGNALKKSYSKKLIGDVGCARGFVHVTRQRGENQNRRRDVTAR